LCLSPKSRGSCLSMGWAQPLVESVTAAVYVIPTDSPESDGTLAWDSTTMIVVTSRADGRRGLGWTYGSPAVASALTSHLAGVVVGTDVSCSAFSGQGICG
jgi:hypothetical protein